MSDDDETQDREADEQQDEVPTGADQPLLDPTQPGAIPNDMPTTDPGV